MPRSSEHRSRAAFGRPWTWVRGARTGPGARASVSRLLPNTLEKVRPIGRRVVLTASDQVVASLSNLAVGLAIARIAGIAALGAFSLAYVIWLAGADFHRSLITDPMAIENDAYSHDATDHIRTGLASELVLGAVIGSAIAAAGAAFLLAGQHDYGVAFLALAPWVPCLLVQDYWRWVAFMKAVPGRALVNDAAFDVVQGLGFALLLLGGLRSPVLAISAWGLGAFAGALLGLHQHSVLPTLRNGIGGMRRRWHMSRWLFGASITHWCSSQGYLLFTGLLLGPVAIGGLKAAQGLISGPSLVLFQLGGNIGLPEASRALERRGWPGLRRVERILTAAAGVCVGAVALVVFLFGQKLLVVVYGPAFGRFAVVADVLALSVVLSSLDFGAIQCLKATKLTGMIFKNSALMLMVSVVSVAVLVPLFGVLGAACAVAVRTSATSATTLWLHWRYSRREAERLSSERARAARDMVGRTSVTGVRHALAAADGTDAAASEGAGDGSSATSSLVIW